MDVEKETKMEYNAITVFLMIIGILVLVVIIGVSSNFFELKAEDDAIQIISSSATSQSISFTITSQHTNPLTIQNILVDGKQCQACLNSPVIKKRGELTISCANIPHDSATYKHAVAIEFGNKKKTYTQVKSDLITGILEQTHKTQNEFTPLFEKVYKTSQQDEQVSDVLSNSCPQFIVTGTRKDINNDYNLYTYSFDKMAELQQAKEWDLNSFDTGISLTQSVLGKTIIYGHTYHQTQGGDTIILTTDDFTSSFSEDFRGNAKTETAKYISTDADNFKYIVTEIADKAKELVIEKQDTNTETIWTQTITLTQFETYLTADIFEDKLHIITSSSDAKSSQVNIFNESGENIKQFEVPAIVQGLIFDETNNQIITIGKVKTQAHSDAIITVYTSDWVPRWSKTWGSLDSETYTDVTVHNDGTIYVVGSFEIEPNDFRSFLHKYTKNGVLLDSYLFRAAQSLKVTNVELSQEGLYAIGETYDGTQHDVYIAKFE